MSVACIIAVLVGLSIRNCRNTTLPVVGFNPEYYMRSYSEYNTSKEGIKIELLYRKVGGKVWNKAFNSLGKPTVLLQIKQNDIVSVGYNEV